MASYDVASNICQAPVDGQRLSPCQYECDIEFGFCYDVCVSYFVDDAELQDEFDPFCAARKALAERDALVLAGPDVPNCPRPLRRPLHVRPWRVE